jgi:hypothetical protein
MPICPKCGTEMKADQVISLAGVQDKEVSWRCDDDDVEAGAVHPVQMSFFHIGDETEQGGRHMRIIKLEMQGAELLVFREAVEHAHA